MSDPAAISVLYDLTKRDDLSSMLADVLIAVAVVRTDEPSPHEVAREAAKSFGWSEEKWRDEVLPHLREELALEEVARDFRAALAAAAGKAEA